MVICTNTFEKYLRIVHNNIRIIKKKSSFYE